MEEYDSDRGAVDLEFRRKTYLAAGYNLEV